MSVALFVALFAGVFVALFLGTVAFLNPETERKHRRARERDLAMYRHLPESNLLKLND